MNTFIRIVFIIFAFALAVFSLVFFLMLVNGDILSDMLELIILLTEQT